MENMSHKKINLVNFFPNNVGGRLVCVGALMRKKKDILGRRIKFVLINEKYLIN